VRLERAYDKQKISRARDIFLLQGEAIKNFI